MLAVFVRGWSGEQRELEVKGKQEKKRRRMTGAQRTVSSKDLTDRVVFGTTLVVGSWVVVGLEVGVVKTRFSAYGASWFVIREQTLRDVVTNTWQAHGATKECTPVYV